MFTFSLIKQADYFLLNLGLIMARVTIEDCLENVENRFKLCLIWQAQEARQLSHGATEVSSYVIKIKIPFLALPRKLQQVTLRLRISICFIALVKHTTIIPCSN